MKNLFFSVLIFSILLAVCGCSNNLTDQEPTTDTTDVERENPSQPTNNPSEGETESDTNITVQDEGDTVIIVPTETEPEDGDPPTETEPPTVTEPPTDIEPPTETEPPDFTPLIVINELRTEFSSSPKHAEYIEFKVKKSGNLQGIKLYCMWSSIMPYVFNLPAIDVKEGYYITYHLRTLESSNINELGDNLALSGGNDACSTARDLYVSGTGDKWLHKTDIVYLQDADGNILDAVVLNETPDTAWSKERQHFTELLNFLFSKGAWVSSSGGLPNHLDAVDTSTVGSATTRSICRYENSADTNTKNDWYVTDNNGNSPGLPNK